ncbi:MAG: sialidase family protein, partial [Lachnospiraceae bacterium]
YTIWLYEKNGVTVTVDFTELEEMLDQAKDEYPENKDAENAVKFTAATWTPFKTAREAAKDAVANQVGTDLSQEEVENLEWTLRNAMNNLILRPIRTEAKEYKYVLDESGSIQAGEKYLLYLGFADTYGGPAVITMNVNGTITALQDGASVRGNELILDTSARSEESQVWEAVAVDGDKFALKSTYGGTTRYLDLNRSNNNNIYLSATPIGLSIEHSEAGNYNISGQYTITWLVQNAVRYAYAKYNATTGRKTPVALYKKTLAASSESQDLNIDTSASLTGTTQGQPFTEKIEGSANFGSPSLTTFGNGKVAAAATIQWNSTNNYGGSDVVVSVSSNDGWEYKTPLYFNDTAKIYVPQGASFSDPMLMADNSGKLYLLANLFPGGTGKVSGRTTGDAPWSPQQASGYVEINGEQRLVLYYTAITDQQNNNNYDYYVGDFVTIGDKDYAPVYEYFGGENYAEEPSYYVDREYYLYEAVADSDPKPMYCKQRAGSGETQKWVQQNVFFFESYLHVRSTNYLVLTTSENGKDWSEFTILNPTVKSNTEAFYGTAAGGQGIVMGNLLVFPCYSWGNTSGGNQYASIIYSNDGGQTWHRGPQATVAAASNESSVVKLDDNRLRMFVGDNNAWLEYVDYTWNGQEWSVSEMVSLNEVIISRNLQHSAITYEYQGKTMIMVSAPRSQNYGDARLIDGKIYTFEVGNDAARTMTLVDTYDMDPDLSNDYFARSALTGLSSNGEGNGVGILYESQGTPDKKITYDSVRMEDILGNTDFQTKVTGTIENRVYDGKKVILDELVKDLKVEKVPQDRTGDITWEVYADEAGRNQLTEMPKDAGTYWVKARVAADDKYKVNKSNAIPFTIEQRPLTISYVVVEDEEGNSLSGNSLSGNSLSGNTLVAHGTLDVYFDGLATVEETGEQEVLTIGQDYTAALAYNHENLDAASELEVMVTLINSTLGKNYVLTSPTYTFEAEGYENIWLSTIWSKEYTGGQVTQSFSLADGNTLLKEGVDYTVSYKNNINASEWELPKSDTESKEPKMVVEVSDNAGVQLTSMGGTIDPSQIKDPSFNAKKAPQMIIKMKGNYTGTYTIYYQIEKVSLTDNEDIAADDLTVTYTGKNQTPIPVVTWKGKKLVNNKDFYVEEYITKKADKTAFTGKANEKTEITLTLVGKGNYTGKKEIKLIIGKKDPTLEEVSMSKVTVKGIKTLVWNQNAGGMTQAAISVNYKNDALTYQQAEDKREYTIRYENNTAVGTATLVLEG